MTKKSLKQVARMSERGLKRWIRAHPRVRVTPNDCQQCLVAKMAMDLTGRFVEASYFDLLDITTGELVKHKFHSMMSDFDELAGLGKGKSKVITALTAAKVLWPKEFAG